MKHVMSHDLAPDVARKVAERAFDTYKARFGKYDPQITWQSDTRATASFSAKGMSLKGVIELRPRSISFDFDVPFLLRMFQNSAIAVMERELAHWVAQAKAGQI